MNDATTARAFVNRYNAGDFDSLTEATSVGVDVDQDWNAGATRVVFADGSVAVFDGPVAEVSK